MSGWIPDIRLAISAKLDILPETKFDIQPDTSYKKRPDIRPVHNHPISHETKESLQSKQNAYEEDNLQCIAINVI